MAETESTTASAPPTIKAPILLLAGLAALGEFAATAFLPAITVMAESLETSIATVQATVTVGLLSFAICGLIIGGIADSLGRRTLLLPALGLYLLGSLCAALAPSVAVLFAGRVLQAVGTSAGLIASRAIARDLRSGADLIRLLSAVTLAFSLAPAIAPLLGGLLETWLGWRAIFGCAFLYGCAVLIGVWRIPETKTSPAAAVHPTAILSRYLGILKRTDFLIPSLTAASLLGALFAFLVGAAPIFVDHFGLSPAIVGTFPMLTMFGLIGGTIITRGLSARMKPARIVQLGVLISLVGSISMALIPPSVVGFLGTMLLFNFGLGLVLPVATSMAMGPFGDQAGAASALMGFVHLTGGAIGSMIVPLLDKPFPIAVPFTMVLGTVFALALSLPMRSPKEGSLESP